MSQFLHLIAFDLPYPPDYGGATDIYHKIRSLHALGVKVILHVFLYKGKKPAPELNQITVETHYYFRRRLVNPFWGKEPYVVITRQSKALLHRLMQDNHPILFEGLHTTAYLNHPKLQHRIKLVRAHNIEHNYYKALGDAELRSWKKSFFYLEAKRLERYESILSAASAILSISPMEHTYFQRTYGKTTYVPAFHSNAEVVSLKGNGNYILYHGNLGIPENDRAARFLATEVFPMLSMPCIIAGSHPSLSLQKAMSALSHGSLRANLSADEIFNLVQNAQVNVLVTFQSTGIKLKLLNALYRGRHIVTNGPMVEETGLDTLCRISDHPTEIAELIQQQFDIPFTEDDITKRWTVLDQQFNNESSAAKILNLLQQPINS